MRSTASKKVLITANVIATTGEGTSDKPYTVEDAILLNDSWDYGWVKGYIVGCVDWNTGELVDYVIDGNIALGSDEAGTSYIAVELPAGEIYNEINLLDNPKNLGREISLKGNIATYCNHAGMIDTDDYIWAPIPTAIDNAQTGNTGKTTKRIENGQLIIIRDGVKYNAFGVKQAQ